MAINYTGSRQKAQEAVKEVVAKGGKAVAIQADVSKPAEVQRLFDEAQKALGPLDIVVANAGVYLSKPLIESTEDDYDHVFDINTRGVFFMLQEAARRVRDGGRIIFPPAARSSPSLIIRYTSAARRQWSNSPVRFPVSWVRAV